MKFIFITAIRIAPEHWITWRQAIAARFFAGSDVDGFTSHTGRRAEVTVGTDSATVRSAPIMGQAFASLKAQDLYHKTLPTLGHHPDETAHLIVLKSGELCRVDVVLIDTEKAEAQYADFVDRIENSLAETARQMIPFLPKGLTCAQVILNADYAIHTLMPFDKLAPAQPQTVATFFAREGLQFDMPEDKAEPFFPGWSFSALACTNPSDIGLFAAVVMRLQCVWYQQRGQRDFCIAQTGLLARRASVETDITTSHDVIRRLFDFTLWEHELREFSANLKPWLKSAFDAIYKYWDMAAESAYVEKTLKQSHELLASGYQSRMLIQERQQSRLLFVIAAVGLLGIGGSLMSIWTALSWGDIVTQSFWKTAVGFAILVGLVGSIFIALVVVLYRFISTHIR
jgi:hypothetical protein